MKLKIMSAVFAFALVTAGTANAHELSTVTVKAIDHVAQTLTADDGTVYNFEDSIKDKLAGLTPGNIVVLMWDNEGGEDHHVVNLSGGQACE